MDVFSCGSETNNENFRTTNRMPEKKKKARLSSIQEWTRETSFISFFSGHFFTSCGCLDALFGWAAMRPARRIAAPWTWPREYLRLRELWRRCCWRSWSCRVWIWTARTTFFLSFVELKKSFWVVVGCSELKGGFWFLLGVRIFDDLRMISFFFWQLHLVFIGIG